MKRNSILAFVAAVLFVVAAVLGFISGSSFRGVIGTIAAISFLLTGLHWNRRSNL
jgi:hypothetical protein